MFRLDSFWDLRQVGSIATDRQIRAFSSPPPASVLFGKDNKNQRHEVGALAENIVIITTGVCSDSTTGRKTCMVIQPLKKVNVLGKTRGSTIPYHGLLATRLVFLNKVGRI